jgi:hypothetical protein
MELRQNQPQAGVRLADPQDFAYRERRESAD